MKKKERYDYLKRQGLCVRCGGKRDRPNRITCSKCAEYQKSSRKLKLSVGICPRCKTNEVMIGRTLCEYCAEKQYASNEEYRAKNREWLNYKGNQARKLKREQRIASGMCSTCGNPLPYQSMYKTCSRCRVIEARHQREVRLKNNIGLTFDERYSGISKCVNCLKNERYKGYKICKECYDRLCLNRNKGHRKNDVAQDNRAKEKI